MWDQKCKSMLRRTWLNEKLEEKNCQVQVCIQMFKVKNGKEMHNGMREEQWVIRLGVYGNKGKSAGVQICSVEHNTGFSSWWVEYPVVGARLGSQVRLVILHYSLVRRWGRGGKARDRHNSRLLFRRHRGWRGDFHLHLRWTDLGFRS